jgi:DNA-binding beta-propeller fold protein YncE
MLLLCSVCCDWLRFLFLLLFVCWYRYAQAVRLAGRHIRTLAIAGGGNKYGMVVTPDGRYMAVSYFSEDKLRVYRIEADGALTLLHTFGGKGAGPKKFKDPLRMCLAPNGNLLVCDRGNDRVQELTGLGEAEPPHMRDLKVTNPRTIAVHGDMVAVGTRDATVVLLSYATGTIIRTFGSKGSGRGNIGTAAAGLRFTLDGVYILVAEYSNKRLSKFCVSDGAFVDFYCEGQVSDGNIDVEIVPSGEVIVADCSTHHMCAFSADGRTLLRTWGTYGSADGQFKQLTALALVGSKLFVLDGYSDSARTQVFE